MCNFFSTLSGVAPTFTVAAINFKSWDYQSKGRTDTVGCSIDEGLSNIVEVGLLVQDLKKWEDMWEIGDY